MDQFTIDHLFDWAEQTIPAHLQSETIRRIGLLVEDHPDLLNTHSWPEMRELAERNYS